MGLAAYSYLLKLHGDNSEAEYYDNLNKEFIQFWLRNASVSGPFYHIDLSVANSLFVQDGDHYRLQYNLSDTWSLKYNLLFQV